ncbi:hypothetical protein BJX61DRAFT_553085 [Aspergillus egyptiacus]|nr:hypothetical protein BJX61DRAFT_553085 [Aspergillus egyptiacus]
MRGIWGFFPGVQLGLPSSINHDASYSETRRERCYIGVKGIPCTTCDRLNLQCDGRANVHLYCSHSLQSHWLEYTDDANLDGLFAAHLQKTELEQQARWISPPRVSTRPRPETAGIPDYITGLPEPIDAADTPYIEVPVLDLERFLKAMADNDGGDPISLLLFHAVMFAGAAFVDISHIYQEGYTPRKAARDILYRRAKILLELECEDDRLATVQPLLLLVHWHDIQNTEKDSTHLIGICLSLAISIGLHRSPDEASMPLRQQQVWRRTWWSLYNHARLTSEDLLAMMTIEGDHHATAAPEVAIVTLADFPLEILPPEIRAVVDDCEVLRSLEQQTVHAQLFVEKTKLCCLTQFSSFSNGVKNLVLASDQPATSRRSPRLGYFLAKRSLEELEGWYHELPSTVHHSVPVSLTLTPWERSIYLHRAWLKLLYVGTSYAITEQQVREMNHPRSLSFTRGYSLVLEQSLIEATDIFEEVYSLDLSGFLPAPATALLVVVLIYHRRLSQTPTAHGRKSALKLHQCWNIMHQLHDASALAKEMDGLLTDGSLEDRWDWLDASLLAL